MEVSFTSIYLKILCCTWNFPIIEVSLTIGWGMDAHETLQWNLTQTWIIKRLGDISDHSFCCSWIKLWAVYIFSWPWSHAPNKPVNCCVQMKLPSMSTRNLLIKVQCHHVMETLTSGHLNNCWWYSSNYYAYFCSKKPLNHLRNILGHVL